MDSPFFGWELLYAIIEDKIRCPSDIVVAFVHWQMIKFSFSCLGNGDEVQMQYLMESFLMMLPNYHMSCVPLSLPSHPEIHSERGHWRWVSARELELRAQPLLITVRAGHRGLHPDVCRAGRVYVPLQPVQRFEGHRVQHQSGAAGDHYYQFPMPTGEEDHGHDSQGRDADGACQPGVDPSRGWLLCLLNGYAQQTTRSCGTTTANKRPKVHSRGSINEQGRTT